MKALISSGRFAGIAVLWIPIEPGKPLIRAARTFAWVDLAVLGLLVALIEPFSDVKG